MSETDEAFREIVFHKASRMRGSAELRQHIEDLLRHEDVAWDVNAPQLLPAVDAMIFDVCSALARKNCTSLKYRRALILEIWRTWRKQEEG